MKREAVALEMESVPVARPKTKDARKMLAAIHGISALSWKRVTSSWTSEARLKATREDKAILREMLDNIERDERKILDDMSFETIYGFDEKLCPP